MATEAQLQRLLDRIAKDSCDARRIACELYGPNAQIYAEGEGSLVAMSDDCDGGAADRQSFIKLEAKGIHQLAVGAW
ncbi:hypothetical protein ABE494_06400 [Stenotrophomonas lactitubi]|uniref:hypothetical protein n=1 Tax=Stenotrophomonas lactitubi TaxID=2045214 RepID=UPI00203B7F80|nr:hypothetical protein [Stenotrophomonas lactitubi]